VIRASSVRRLASGANDGTIQLWDVARGADAARLKGHSAGVTALCVLPDGRLASGAHDGKIRLWDVARGTESSRLEGHIRLERDERYYSEQITDLYSKLLPHDRGC